MKTRIIFIITLFCAHSSFAKIPGSIGIRAAGGLSKIDYKYRLLIRSHEINPSAAWQAGIYFRHALNKKFHVGTELNYSSISSKEKFVFDEYDNAGNPNGYFSRTTYYKSLSYISLPVYAGVSLGPVDLNVGIQFNHLLESHGKTVNRIENAGGTDEIIDKFPNLEVKNRDVGARAGLIVKISPKFSADASFYYGVSNIYNGLWNPLGWDWKVRQANIGLRYKLFGS